MKRKITLILVTALMLCTFIPVMAAQGSPEKASTAPLTVSRGGTIPLGKSEFTTSELLELFPNAYISKQMDAQLMYKMASGEVLDSVNPNAKPIQRFMHEFEDGSKIYLDVYADTSRNNYGVTLGTKSTSGGVDTYKDSVAYWRSVGSNPVWNLEFYVTHTVAGGSSQGVNGAVSSHRIKKVDPGVHLQVVSSSSDKVKYACCFIISKNGSSNPQDWDYLISDLEFNARTIAASVSNSSSCAFHY